MKVTQLRLRGLKLISPVIWRDERGFFKESFYELRYQELGNLPRFVQDNHSFSQKSVLRGMHFQISPEGWQQKLIWVSQGKIFDVAVDMRKGSPTFGEWEGIYLDDTSQQQLFIPAGFAHGFCVVSGDGAHVHYKVDLPYNREAERGFRYDDLKVQIQWPVSQPIVSRRDLKARGFLEAIQ